MGVFYLFFMVGILNHMLHNFILVKLPGGTGGWYLYAVIVPEIILLVYGLESMCLPQTKRLGSLVAIFYVILLNFLGYFCKMIPFYSGFFIPRFHVQHFFKLYLTPNIDLILKNLSVNKPTFISSVFLVGLISLYIGLVIIALRWWVVNRDSTNSER